MGTRDVIFFEGTSVEQLTKEFRFSIDDYLAMCAERGQAPDKPFSGEDSSEGFTGGALGGYGGRANGGKESERLDRGDGGEGGRRFGLIRRPASCRQPRADPAVREEEPSDHRAHLTRGPQIRPDFASRRLRLGQCETPRQLIGSPLTARWCITYTVARVAKQLHIRNTTD